MPSFDATRAQMTAFARTVVDQAVAAINAGCDRLGAHDMRSDTLNAVGESLKIAAQSYRCPVCKWVSYNENDRRYGFCSNCKTYTGASRAEGVV